MARNRKIYFKIKNMINKNIFQENELDNLKKIIEQEKNNWKTIVWTNWCFDIMHPGHMRTFEIAKNIWENTIVIVWINGKDSPYWKTKPWRPINDEEFRSKMLASLKNIDYIYIFNDTTPARPVNELKPNYVLKWWDYYIKELKVESKKSKEIEKFNKIVEKELVKSWNWILDITDIYKYFIENNLIDIVKNISWFMEEWYINVKNWWKVVLVPIVEWCSTTNIVEKLQPKIFTNLINFWNKYSNNFTDLQDFLVWYNKKLNINFLKRREWRKFKQFQIYLFELWINIWWETNKKRPILIIWKTSWFLNSKTILWVIITSLYDDKWNKKTFWKFDILIKSNKQNWLKKDSIIKLWKIIELDKKRVLKYLWKIDKEEQKNNILSLLKKVFWIKK